MKILKYEELTHSQRQLYLDTLNVSHTMQVALFVYSKNEVLLGEINEEEYGLISGQVDVDLSQPVYRQLTMDLQQENATFATDVKNGPFNPGKFLAVDYHVRVPDVDSGDDAWVSVRCFYGPTTVVQFDHNLSTTHVEAQSKESLYLPPNIAANTADLGGHTTDIKMTLSNLVKRVTKDMGETKFRISKAKAKIIFNHGRYDGFARKNGAWPYLKKQSHDRGFILFFDRRGFLTMRKMNKRPRFTFSTKTIRDNNGVIILKPNVSSVPEIAFDATTYLNGVQVYGKLRAKGKVRLLGAAYDPVSAIFSPEGLKRNNHPRLMLSTITTSDVMTRKKANKRAKAILAHAQLSSQSSSFDCLPVPHLDLHDAVRLHGDFDGVQGGGEMKFIPQQWTLPLVPGELMSIGYNSRIRVITKTRGHIRRHLRHHRRHHH